MWFINIVLFTSLLGGSLLSLPFLRSTPIFLIQYRKKTDLLGPSYSSIDLASLTYLFGSLRPQKIGQPLHFGTQTSTLY